MQMKINLKENWKTSCMPFQNHALLKGSAKMNKNLFVRLMLLAVFSCCCQVFGQEKINVTWGIGFPELLNFGVRYEMGQTQIGVNYGSMPHTGAEGFFSISSDAYYHFGGTTTLSERRPWYARI